MVAQIESNLKPFNKVNIFGKLNVRLEKAGYDSILIQSSDFDVKQVKFDVADSVLSVKLLTEFPPVNKVNVTIFFNEMNSLDAGGGVKIYNRGAFNSKFMIIEAGSGAELDLLVELDSIKTKVNKGAFVRLRGKSNYLNIKTSTGGDFRSTELDNNITEALLRGGSAEIKTAEFLDAKVTLKASLKYVDQPAKIKRKERLGGKIEKLEDF